MDAYAGIIAPIQRLGNCVPHALLKVTSGCGKLVPPHSDKAEVVVWRLTSNLLEYFDKLVTGEASAPDDPQGQPTAQIAIMPGHDYTAIVAWTPENDVTAR
jgi:hypothetical protein